MILVFLVIIKVTMREVEREELEAVKNVAMTALDLAKPI